MMELKFTKRGLKSNVNFLVYDLFRKCQILPSNPYFQICSSKTRTKVDRCEQG